MVTGAEPHGRDAKPLTDRSDIAALCTVGLGALAGCPDGQCSGACLTILASVVRPPSLQLSTPLPAIGIGSSGLPTSSTSRSAPCSAHALQQRRGTARPAPLPVEWHLDLPSLPLHQMKGTQSSHCTSRAASTCPTILTRGSPGQ